MNKCSNCYPPYLHNFFAVISNTLSTITNIWIISSSPPLAPTRAQATCKSSSSIPLPCQPLKVSPDVTSLLYFSLQIAPGVSLAASLFLSLWFPSSRSWLNIRFRSLASTSFRGCVQSISNVFGRSHLLLAVAWFVFKVPVADSQSKCIKRILLWWVLMNALIFYRVSNAVLCILGP